MNRKLFDIIIPSWNMSEYAINCLLSIKANSFNYRVIFVDNGSEENEFERVNEVLQKMPHLLIQNETNLGFIKATNAGIKASDAPFIILMNNDTEAVTMWLQKLMNPLRKVKEAGLSGPLTTTVDSWQGRYPKGRRGFILREKGMLAFFCTMIKREVIEKVGLLDEVFGVGFGDDDDYCHRALNAGFKLALVQDLVIPHHHRSTFKSLYSMEMIKEMQTKAIDKYYRKHKITKNG
jgi:GT2 family glycosyltransferase